MFCRLAVKQLSEIEGWSNEQLKAIIDRAKTVWAQAVNEWDKDQVSELGKLLSKSDYCTAVLSPGQTRTRVVESSNSRSRLA